MGPQLPCPLLDGSISYRMPEFSIFLVFFTFVFFLNLFSPVFYFSPCPAARGVSVPR